MPTPNCSDKERAWWDKLNEASEIWGQMLDADKEVMETYNEAKDALLVAWSEVLILWWHGEAELGAELALAEIIIEGSDREEQLEKLAAEQQYRNELYKDTLKESDALLDELCKCERGEQ